MTDRMTVLVHNAELAASLGVAIDTPVQVDCRQGVPIEREWRNRLRDAHIDKCVSIVKDSQKVSKKEGAK